MCTYHIWRLNIHDIDILRLLEGHNREAKSPGVLCGNHSFLVDDHFMRAAKSVNGTIMALLTRLSRFTNLHKRVRQNVPQCSTKCVSQCGPVLVLLCSCFHGTFELFQSFNGLRLQALPRLVKSSVNSALWARTLAQFRRVSSNTDILTDNIRQFPAWLSRTMWFSTPSYPFIIFHNLHVLLAGFQASRFRALQLFSLRLSNLDEQLKGLSWRMSKSSAWLKTMDGHTDAAARQNTVIINSNRKRTITIAWNNSNYHIRYPAQTPEIIRNPKSKIRRVQSLTTETLLGNKII
jgi:hypothetical protein